MKFAISIILLLACPLLVNGQVTISIPDGVAPIDTTLVLPVDLSVGEGDVVSAIHVRFKYDPESIEFIGIERSASISDSILVVANGTDSTIIVSFASTHPISSSGLLISLQFTPKRIGLTELIITEVRFDEQDSEFPNIPSAILITDEFGNTPPFFVDIPDTLTFFTGESIEIDLENTVGDAQDEFEDLILELTNDGVAISFVIDPVENILTLTAPEEEGEGSLGLKITDSGGASVDISIAIIVKLLVSNEELELDKKGFVLLQNYPNPFNPSTEIAFSISGSSLVTLTVYNMLGQEVATLINSRLNSGSHRVSFDASALTSGTYIYRIKAGEFVETKKMMLIK
ncbi:MAG: hypothetical protein BalsKO_10900 [Balneolaceae bacterium]